MAITAKAVYYNSDTGKKRVSFKKNADPLNAPDGHQLIKPEENAEDVKKRKLLDLKINTQEYVNNIIYAYCDAEQKTWPSKIVPQAQKWLDDNTVETPFLDRWVTGMLADDDDLVFEDAKLDLANAINNNEIDYSELLPLILGVTTSRRDRVKEIYAEETLTNQEKVDAIEAISSDVGTFIYEYLQSLEEE